MIQVEQITSAVTYHGEGPAAAYGRRSPTGARRIATTMSGVAAGAGTATNDR